MANKIRKGDTVIVMAGRDKGRKGTVIEVRDDDTLIVENVNRVKKHQKGNPQSGVPGGIIEKEAPLHASKVMPVDPKTGKPTRVRAKTDDKGRKIRIAVKSGEELPTAKAAE